MLYQNILNNRQIYTIILLFVLIIIFCFILKIKINKKLFKIQSFFFTYTVVILYIAYNIGFYFLLRLLRWGQL